MVELAPTAKISVVLLEKLISCPKTVEVVVEKVPPLEPLPPVIVLHPNLPLSQVSALTPELQAASPAPKKLAAKRFVDEAVVANELVLVELVVVEFVAVKFCKVEEPVASRLVKLITFAKRFVKVAFAEKRFVLVALVVVEYVLVMVVLFKLVIVEEALMTSPAT